MTRILVADDEPMVREALVKILETAGYEIVEAKTGKEACQLAEERRPDVMLLDVDMPVMNGFEALQVLRQSPNTKDLPIIMLTSTPAVVGEQAALMYGVSHYISKPWKGDMVEAAVRIVLRSTGASAVTAGTKSAKPDEADQPGGVDEPDDGDKPAEDETENNPLPKVKVRKVENYREALQPNSEREQKPVADDPIFPGSLADSQG